MLIKEQLLASGQYNITKTSNKLFAWGLGTSGQTTSVLYLFSLAQLSAGASHAVALTSDNRLLAWGLNTSGQLGDGTTINKSFPQQVGSKGGWKKVSAGASFTIALRGNSLYAWGINTSGQLGDNSIISKSSPVQIGSAINWNTVDAGQDFAIGNDTSYTLYGWGLNSSGQLGDSTIVSRSSPTQVSYTVSDLSTNNTFTTGGVAAINTSIVPFTNTPANPTTNGTSLALNLTKTGAQLNTADQITTTSKSGFAIAAYTDYTVEVWIYLTALNPPNNAQIYSLGLGGTNAWQQFAITALGAITWQWGNGSWGWSDNITSSTGLITTSTWYHLAVVKQGTTFNIYRNGTSVVTKTLAGIANGQSGTLFIGSYYNDFNSDQSYLKGYISNLRIAAGVAVYTGTFTPPTSPLATTQSSGTNISAITAGQTQLLTSYFLPTIPSFVQLSAGTNSSYGINTAGLLFSWGNNSAGQLGLTNVNAAGDTLNRSYPVQIGSSSWSSVSSGASHAAAISVDSTLYTWGLNNAGQLGFTNPNSPFNPDTINRSSPVQVTMQTTMPSWKLVSAGNSYTLAIGSDDKLYAWGLNNNYQLGFVTNSVSRSVPIQITTGSWALISAGGLFTVATNNNKLLYTWGNGAGGTLADGTTSIRSSPTLVSFLQTISQSSPVQIGASSWTAITSGSGFLAAIRSDGLLFTWGANNSGQLGDNSSIAKSSPVQVNWAGGASWLQVTATTFNILAIASNSTLWAWGLTGENLIQNVSIGANWSIIAKGANHTAGIRTDGTLWTWGGNQAGQLGLANVNVNGDTINRSSPVQVTSITGSWSAVSAGSSFTVGVLTTGVAYAWGLGAGGQLGTGTTINRSIPTLVTGSYSWSSVSSGLSNTIGLRADNIAMAWGQNTSGQLGDNTTVTKSNPVLLATPFDTTSWTQITAGSAASYGIRNSDQALYAWGLNLNGQLGDNTTVNKSNPIVVTGSYSWSFVAGGTNNVYGIQTNGSLWSFGRNPTGQLGDNTTLAKSNPVQISASSWIIVGSDASGTGDGVLAIRADGALFGWGLQTSGAWINGTGVNQSVPVQITHVGNTRHEKIALGGSAYAATVNGNSLYVWGRNDVGQVGDSTTVYRSNAVYVGTALPNAYSSPVQIGTSSWSQVKAGSSLAVAIDINNKLYTWGLNSSGQLGDLSTLNRYVPFQLGNLSWSQASAGSLHILAITSNKQLYAWGSNLNYQLGDNTNANKSSPIQIGTSYAGEPINSWTQASAGTLYSLAIDSNYKLYGWGVNSSGQLGLVTEAYSWTQIDSGQVFSGAIRQDGTLWFWGTNTNGNLGTQDTTPKSSPTQIGTSSWTQVSVTKFVTNTAAAIRSDGALYLWGVNSAGQLGDNTTINKSSPVQIGSSSWSQVSVGDSHTLAIDAVGRLFGWGLATALNASTAPFSWTVVSENTSHVVAVRSDGLLFTWGLNSSGQLGDNTTVNKISPTQIGNSSWTIASAGIDHTLAVTSDNRLFSWGGNAAYQLGDNTTINKSSPVQVVNPIVSWTSVTAANSFSMGLTATNLLYVWGLGTSGQLGTLTEILSWSAISAGSSNSLAIRNDSRLYGWGLNTGFQLGDGSSITKSSPVQVAGTLSWSQASAGINHTLAITNNGELYGWGVATTGATGNFGEVYSWNMVAGSGDNTFFIRSDGSLWATGPNTLGVLGLNDTFARSSPVQVGTSSWIFVNAGGSASGPVFGITSDYKLFSWGANDSGQCADGSTIRKSSPVQIGIGSSWIQAATGGSGYSLMLKSDYTLWTAGIGVNGRLGLNDVISRSNPTQIGTSSWTQIAVGSASLAIRVDNTLWSWGVGNFGQLGIGVTTDRSSPVQVTTPGTGPWLAVAANEDYSLAISGAGLGTPYSVYFIGGANIYGQAGLNTAVGSISLPTLTKAGAAGSSFVQVTTNGLPNADFVNHALTSDGKMWGWGYNVQGMLGDGTIVSKSSPVLVTGTTSWSQLPKRNAGRLNYGIATNNILWGWGLTPFYVTYNADPIQVSNPIQIGGNIRWANYNSPIYAINSEAGQGSWTAVAAGNSFSFGIKNNLLYGWGQNASGQTGTNLTRNPIFSPTQIGTSSWSVVSASELGSFAGGIDSSSRLFMWGAGLAQTALTESSVSPQWNQLSIGLSHTIALRSDGTLWAWGGNAGGQLGDGTTVNKSSPVQIGTSSWIQVATGYGSSYAIKIDGTLWSWGINDSGTLGLNLTSGNRSSPTQIGTSSWSLVAAGYYSAYGLLPNGQLYSWGDNGIGQLATNDLVLRSSPTLISGGGTYRYVHSSGRLTAGIRTDNTLWMWGYGASGGIGNGGVAAQAIPIQVTTGSSTWSKVVVFGTIGANEQLLTGAAGITTSGTLYTWGAFANGAAAAYRGQVTIPTITLFSTTTSFTNITSGIAGVLFATDTNNNLWAWGANDFGQLGNNDAPATNRSSPVILASTSGTSWTLLNNMSNGYNGSLINTNLNCFIWGNNATGQLGLGDTINRSSPVQLAGSWVQTSNIYQLSFLSPVLATTTSSPVQIGNSSWTQLSTGTSHSLAIRADSTLWIWGINDSNSVLGFNDTVTRSSPTQLGTSSWSQVSAGYNHSMAIKTDGTLWGWGTNTFGQVGAYSAPYSWTSLAVRGQSSIAIRTDGSLWVWGINSSGQLGLGDTINRSSPTLLDAGSWNFATCGYFSAAAIKSDGTLWTWGLNAQGMLGHGDNVAKSSPVQVLGGGSWTQVACANYYTTALKTDGTAFSMGWNQNGNLGTNNTISYNSPTAVAGGLSFAQLAVLQGSLQGNSNGQTYALTPAGILYTWGANINGLAGIGDGNARSAPTLLSSPWNVTVWNKIFTGELNVFAIRNDGALYAWGGPRLELLGINSAGSAYITSPIAVNAGFSYVSVASGQGDAGGATFAIRSDGSLYTWGWNTSGSQWSLSAAAVRSSPTLLDSGSWTSIDAGVLNSVVSLKNGIPYAWGLNTSGQLGIGDIINRSSPVQIGNAPDINTLSPVQIGSSSWSQVSAGNQFTLARDINGNLYTWGQDTSGQLGF